MVDKGNTMDWGSDTQELEWAQRRVRDSENGSKGKLNNNKKSPFQKETRTGQQRSVTYDKAENYSAYQSHSHSSFPAVFCDNIVQKCVVLSVTHKSLGSNTIQRL